MANITDIERLNYYEGEFLGAADFQAEQEYHRDMRRRHNVGQHTWGIVSGFDLAQVPNGGKTPANLPEVDIYVKPGMAVDGFGREIVALSKTQLTQDLFAAYYDPNPAAPPIPMYAWISYAQTLLQPPTDACTAMNQPNAFGRLQEGFAVTVTPNSVRPADDLIVVDGTAMPAPVEPASLSSPPTAPAPGAIVLPYDDSVPYQEFSADDTSVNWYIPIGRVYWDPHNTVFVQQPDSWAAAGRRYVGSVASSIESPSSSLTIQDRFAPNPLPTDPTSPFYRGVGVEIVGSLKVDRLLDAVQQVLIGGSYDPTSATPLSPLTIVASGTNEELIQFRNPTGQETWLICENPNSNNPGIHIGEIPAGGKGPGTTRLFIQSTLTGVAPSQVNVGVGTVTPRNPLAIRAQGTFEELLSFEDTTGKTNWHINQNPQGQNFRRGLNFCETGVADFRLFLQVGGNVGIGTPLPQQNLSVNGGVNIDQANANSGSIGPGLSFGGTSGEGIASSRNPGANQWGIDFYTASQARMSITNSGSVGIGTRSPAATLDVNGTVKVENSLTVTGGATVVGNLVVQGGSVAGNETITGWVLGKGASGPDNWLRLTTTEGGSTYHDLAVNQFWAAGSKRFDLAEVTPANCADALEPGDVVVIDRDCGLRVSRSTRPFDTSVYGVVSSYEQASMVIGGFGGPEVVKGDNSKLPIALVGRATAKVSAENGPIEIGDLLTTSSTPGHLMRCGSSRCVGSIAGKALERLDGERGVITIRVSLS